MPRTAMVWNQPTVKVALTEAELTAGAVAAECQLTRAELVPQPTYATIPATGCAGATQSPGLTGYNLELDWLQDWTKPADESLSQFAWANDGLPVWAEVQPNKDDATVTMTGQFYCASGGFGATFGDGSASATSASWPAITKPDIVAPVATP